MGPFLPCQGLRREGTPAGPCRTRVLNPKLYTNILFSLCRIFPNLKKSLPEASRRPNPETDFRDPRGLGPAFCVFRRMEPRSRLNLQLKTPRFSPRFYHLTACPAQATWWPRFPRLDSRHELALTGPQGGGHDVWTSGARSVPSLQRAPLKC